MSQIRLAAFVGFALVLACSHGCGSGGPGRPLSAPSYDPDAAVRDAFSQFDKTGDGVIDGPELDAAPGLKAAFGGKKVTRDALKAKIEQYRVVGAGAVGYSVRVQKGASPLNGAIVTLTPEPFLAGMLKEATGSTDATGTATTFTTGGEPVPGLAAGM
ncbi:MAG TPA: EF-hand domain-containing protein [Urbifossiella sp.]|nr:EF-hand domain-containing protein [Urbifossiella sp.]